MTPFLWIDESSPDLKLPLSNVDLGPTEYPSLSKFALSAIQIHRIFWVPNLRLKNCECGNSEGHSDLFL